MKLALGSLFGSPTKPAKKSKRTRSISRSDTASFGSKSSSEEESTPTSVLISRRELEGVLRRLGPSEEEVAAMLAEAERGGRGRISLEAIGALGGSPTAGLDLRDAFAVFDTDGDGRISAEELLAMFVMLGDEWCTLEDCQSMIGGVDSRGDGFVCFEDFVRMMDAKR